MLFKKISKQLYSFRNLIMLQASSVASIKEFLIKVRPVITDKTLIRVGGKADGGYLIPDDFEGVSVCFSPGVADSSDFELAMAKRGIKSFMADYSVNGPALPNAFFSFEKKFLGTVDDEVYTTLESWIERNAPNETDFILQMDIENSEYSVLEATPRSVLQKFRIMTIEFHRMGNLRNNKELKKVTRVFEKILFDFDVVHIHPNNAASVVNYRGLQIPRLMEFTFLRKDRILSKQQTPLFPHPLDHPNLAAPDVILPSCWYK